MVLCRQCMRTHPWDTLNAASESYIQPVGVTTCFNCVRHVIRCTMDGRGKQAFQLPTHGLTTVPSLSRFTQWIMCAFAFIRLPLHAGLGYSHPLTMPLTTPHPPPCRSDRPLVSYPLPCTCSPWRPSCPSSHRSSQLPRSAYINTYSGHRDPIVPPHYDRAHSARGPRQASS